MSADLGQRLTQRAPNGMDNLSFNDRICLIIATLFGIGYTPFLPGTAACLLAVAAFVFIKSRVYFLILSAVSILLAFFLSGRAEELFQEKDCKKIVIDDFSGMLLALLFIPPDLKLITAGFFIFRLLDILKIPPADKLEKLPGARGIVGDDLVAGIYTNIILQLLRLALKISS